MNRRFFILSFFSLLSIYLTGQNSGHVLQVKDENNKVIKFASILFNGTSKGTITNTNGLFQFPADKNQLITISCIGYKTLVINTDTLTNKIVHLQPRTTYLEELKVTPINAKKILIDAINRIPTNYANNTPLQRAFYREKLYQNSKIKTITECDLKIERNTTTNNDSNAKISIIKVNSFVSDSSTTNLINGPLAMVIQADIVGSKKFILDKQAIDSHRFYLNTIKSYENGEAYEITFHPENKQKFALSDRYFGSLLIDTTNLAIIQATVHKFGALGKIKKAEFNVGYKKWQKSYTLSYSKKTLEFQNSNRVDVDLVITDFDFTDTIKVPHQIYHKDTPLKSYWAKQDFNTLTISPDTFKISAIFKQNRIRYNPSISLSTSNRIFEPTDIAHNLNSINYLIDYALSSTIKNGALWSGLQCLNNLYLINPLEAVLAESSLLRKNKISHKIVPFKFNSSFSSYCKNVNPNDLKELYVKNKFDFIRLNTIRNEMLLTAINDIENQLFINNYSINQFSNIFYLNIFIKRTSLFFNQFSIGQEYLKLKSSSNYSVDRSLSALYYLTKESDVIFGEVKKDDLTVDGNRLLKRVRWFSFLNLVSPFIIGKQNMDINNDLKMSFSLGYILTPIGEDFIQNYWFKTPNNSYKINLSFFKAMNVTGFGLGFCCIQQKIVNNLNLSTKVNYWRQPVGLYYRAKALEDGFAIDQNFKYKLNSKIEFNIGYTLKTYGYMPEFLNYENDKMINIGMNYTF